MDSFGRHDRLAGVLRRGIAQLLHQEVREPYASHATVTDVEVAPDLSIATVYVSAAPEVDRELLLRSLDKVSGFLRSRVGRELKSRSVPALRFRYDDSIERGDRISRLLDEALGGPENEQ